MTDVLFLDQTAQLGGAELCLRDLLSGRCESGDRVVLFEDGRLAEVLRDAESDVVVAPMTEAMSEVRRESGLSAQLAAVQSTYRQVKRIRELMNGRKIVYANTAKTLVVGSIAFRNRPEKLIYHLHDIVTASHFSRVNRWALVTLANRYASRVIANSQATADAFVAAGGKRSLVTVIPNGFDPAPFDQAIETRQGTHDQSVTSRKVVAVFGRLSPWKGQDVAIRAIAQLENVELWIVGDALFGEDDYSDELQALVKELGLEDQVKFLGFREDVLDLMQQADIIAHTSTAPEPFGRVVVEGMLSARPVIASRGGGAQEIIQHGVTGLLSAMGDVEDLAQGIQQLLAAPELANQLATEAARVARERYAIEHCVALTNAVIEEVAAI